MSKRLNQPVIFLFGLLLAASAGLLLLGVTVGSTGFESVANMQRDAQAMVIVWEIRLPRTVGAWLAGALLGLAGAVAQGLFRNPLADPYLLGSASGASLGVALAMALFGVSPLATQWALRLGLTGAAFLGAVAAVLLTLLLAKGVQHTLRLLLAGVVVGVGNGYQGYSGYAPQAYYAPQPQVYYAPPPPVYYAPPRPVYYAPPVVVRPPAYGYYGGGYNQQRPYRHHRHDRGDRGDRGDYGNGYGNHNGHWRR